MWALGVLIYRITTGEEPFQGKTETLLVDAIRSNDRKPMPNHFSLELRNLVDSLLTLTPEKRLTVGELLVTPIILNELESIIDDFLPLLFVSSSSDFAKRLLDKIQEIIIPLTFNYKTSSLGHRLLYKILD